MTKKVWIGIGIGFLLAITVGVSVYRLAFAQPPQIQTIAVGTEEIAKNVMIPGTIQFKNEEKLY
ncbi:hypothetical protein J9303_10050 [Bacillaceae bacterium Marseille-Q3522]|nr:hypothetical protein [Bacillaceae bacterium Marseille-Q3522]